MELAGQDPEVVYRLRCRRKPLAMAIVAALVLLGLAWLYTTVSGPHTASVVIQVEVDRSAGPPSIFRPHIRLPDTEPAWSALLRSPRLAVAVSNRLQVLVSPIAITSDEVLRQRSIDIDVEDLRAMIGFRHEQSETATRVVEAMVAAYEELLDEFPGWSVGAQERVEIAGLDTGVFVAYILGAAAVIAAIPRRWWSEPVGWAEFERGTWWLIGSGVVGLVLSLTPDLIGYGWPGFGALQSLGAFLSVFALAIAVAIVAEEVELEPLVVDGVGRLGTDESAS